MTNPALSAETLSTGIAADLDFKRFHPGDMNGYKDAYRDIDPVSDLSPNNAVVWLDINNDLHAAEDGGNYVLRYSCPFMDDETVFSVVGTQNPIGTIEKVFAYQRARDLPEKLVMVAPATLHNISLTDLKKLRIKEDDENFDYIFSVPEKADLTSEQAGKFRRTIGKFIRDYGDDITIKEVDLADTQQMRKLVNVLHIWKSEDVVSNNDKLGIEAVAIDRYLKHRHELKPKCLEVYLGEVIIGFSIYHYPPQKGYAIINHIKCNYKYKNVFDFTFFSLMNRLKADGIRYANGEQDLGIEGIRNYKHKLGPAAYLKRYTVTPA